jgi:hypothetical protein
MININLDTLIVMSRERQADLLREAELQQLLQQDKATKDREEVSRAKDSSAKHANLASALNTAIGGKLT